MEKVYNLIVFLCLLFLHSYKQKHIPSNLTLTKLFSRVYPTPLSLSQKIFTVTPNELNAAYFPRVLTFTVEIISPSHQSEALGCISKHS